MLALLGTSCAITDAEFVSQVGPRHGRQPFGKILVIGSYDDLIVRKRSEQYLVDLLTSRGVEAIPSMTVLMAGTETDRLPEVVRDLEIEAVLFVGTTDTWSSTSFVAMPSTTNTVVSGNAYSDGQFHATATSTTSGGGFDVSRPHASYRLDLLDKTGQKVWTASASVRGNGYSDWEDLRGRAAREAVNDMSSKGLLPGAPK
jgi:hypothetical protein